MKLRLAGQLFILFAQLPLAQAREAGFIIFDTSGSMRWNGAAICSGPACPGVIASSSRGSRGDDKATPMRRESRLDHAKRIGYRVLQGFSGQGLEIGLLVFGQAGCETIEIPVKFGTPDSKTAVTAVLDGLTPRGSTPIADSFRRALVYIKASGVKVREVTLISDGVETCGGDPVAAARELRKQTGARISVIGLDTSGAAEAQLRSIAGVGAGKYDGVYAVGSGGDQIEVSSGGKDVSFQEQTKEQKNPRLPQLLPAGGSAPDKVGDRPFN